MRSQNEEIERDVRKMLDRWIDRWDQKHVIITTRTKATKVDISIKLTPQPPTHPSIMYIYVEIYPYE